MHGATFANAQGVSAFTAEFLADVSNNLLHGVQIVAVDLFILYSYPETFLKEYDQLDDAVRIDDPVHERRIVAQFVVAPEEESIY